MKKKGFTLIELLAVIVILAVIGVIVIPMMMSTINSSKSGALKASSLNIVSAAENYCAKVQASNSSFSAHSYNINESTSKELSFSYNKSLSGVISIYSDCKVAIKVTDGTYQAVKDKTSDEVVVTNKTTDFNPNDIAIMSPDDCFTYNTNSDNTITITAYDVKTCGTDVNIPNSIKDHDISAIDKYAFSSMRICNTDQSSDCELPKLTAVNFDNMTSLKTIGDFAFIGNSIETLELNKLSSLTVIGLNAFTSNNISNIKISNLPLLTTIRPAFLFNPIKNLELFNLPLLETIEDNAFARMNGTSKDDKGNSISYDNCSPTYTFGTLPSLKDYDSNAKTGVSLYAFSSPCASKCGDKQPTVIYKDNNVSIFKDGIIKYIQDKC